MAFSGVANQQGMALIVVLLVLILIISIGAVAVRRSQTDLRLVSSSQIDTLLLQGADGANMRLEQAVNQDISDPLYEDMVNRNNGLFGHFINNTHTDQDELVYCYNPRELQVNTLSTTIKRDGGTVSGFGPGVCDPNNASSYISARQTVATQVHINRAPTAALEAFEGARQNVNLSNSGEGGGSDTRGSHLFNIEAVSAIPSYNNPANCYADSHANTPAAGKTTADTLAECLQNQSIPNKNLKEQVSVELTSNVISCIELGRGNGQYVNEDQCKPA